MPLLFAWGLLGIGVPVMQVIGVQQSYLEVYTVSTGVLISYAMLERFIFVKK